MGSLQVQRSVYCRAPRMLSRSSSPICGLMSAGNFPPLDGRRKGVHAAFDSHPLLGRVAISLTVVRYTFFGKSSAEEHAPVTHDSQLSQVMQSAVQPSNGLFNPHLAESGEVWVCCDGRSLSKDPA